MATTNRRNTGRNLKNAAAEADNAAKLSNSMAIQAAIDETVTETWRSVAAADTARQKAEGEFKAAQQDAATRRTDAYAKLAQAAHEGSWTVEQITHAVQAACVAIYGEAKANDPRDTTVNPVRSALNTVMSEAIREKVPAIVAGSNAAWDSNQEAMKSAGARRDHAAMRLIRAAQPSKVLVSGRGKTAVYRDIAPTVVTNEAEAIAYAKSLAPTPKAEAEADVTRVLDLIKTLAEKYKTDAFVPAADAIKAVNIDNLLKSARGENVSKQASAIQVPPAAPAPAPATAPEPQPGVTELDEIMQLQTALAAKIDAMRNGK